MDEYIKREAALALLKDDREVCADSKEELKYIRADIRSIPADDVRPVVLCRDCKYWELSKIEPSFRVCKYICGATFVRETEDFCSHGEKRDES